MTQKLRISYVAQQSCKSFALMPIIMPEYDFTYVYSGHLEYKIDDNEVFSVKAGEGMFVSVGHKRERFLGEDIAIYTSIIITGGIIPVELPPHIKIKDSYEVKFCIEKLINYYKCKSLYSDEMSNCLIEYLIYTLSAQATVTQENTYVLCMKNYIHQNWDKNIRLKDISNAAKLSPSYASYVFKKSSGISITDYILSIKLNHALELIKYTNDTMKNISEKTTFCDLYYFSRVFKKHFGLSPTEYRKKFLIL